MKIFTKKHLKSLMEYLVNPRFRFWINSLLGFYHEMDDEVYLKKMALAKLDTDIDLVNPKTFNEKLNWLKIHNRNDEFTEMVDKYGAKRYVTNKIGGQYVIPTLGVWNSFDEIDFERLPNKFVLKCTHDSGSVIICKDKETFDYDYARKKLNSCLKKNWYWYSREWPYKNVTPRIMAEKYMENSSERMLTVYKFMTFNNGETIIQVVLDDKTIDERVDYYTINWEKMDMRQNFQTSSINLSKPKCLDEMIKLAQALKGDIPFLRIDFYEIDSQVFFSEFTFFSDAGFEKFVPESWDLELGNRIMLPTKLK